MKTGQYVNKGKSWAEMSTRNWADWMWQLRNRINTLPQLARILGKLPECLGEYVNVVKYYPFSITPYYLSLVNFEDENDPIRLQCFPDVREIHFSCEDVKDPLKEEQDMPVSGLIHRYPDRCVTIITNDCMTYCRHCNRKRMWKNNGFTRKRQYLRCMIDYISRTTCIREVIISGGDPLTMEEGTLDWFLKSLRSISHLDVLRIGSRVPVVMPMRVTRDLCCMLSKYRPLWFNTQFNHPNEITHESAKACEMLLNAGIPVSNQSVLLRSVNDSYDTMQKLLYGLQQISVRPYYLFQCDPVEGAGHFRTDIWSGLSMMEKLWKNMPGLCMPQYVLDVPGGREKVPLFPFSSMSLKSLSVYGYFSAGSLG